MDADFSLDEKLAELVVHVIFDTLLVHLNLHTICPRLVKGFLQIDHRSKIGSDLIYLRLGTSGNELSFIIIHLQLIVTNPLSDVFNTVFETMDKGWEA